jgi:hypothetical protein
MAGPLTGIGSQNQQLPIANTFQPGQAGAQQRARESDQQQSQPNVVQPRGSSEAGQTQRSNTDNQDVASRQNRPLFSASNDDERSNAGAGRGSLVDITV